MKGGLSCYRVFPSLVSVTGQCLCSGSLGMPRAKKPGVLLSALPVQSRNKPSLVSV